MEIFIKIVAVIFAAIALWLVVQGRYVFVVRIRGGVPRVANGKVTAAFLEALRQVCLEQGVSSGWVRGLRCGQEVSLSFSRTIPLSCQQRLRNLWAIHG